MKKPKLSINERDKSVLLVLIVIIVIFASYYFIISPSMDKGIILSSEKNQASVELLRVNDLVSNMNMLKVEEAKLKNLLTEKYKQFFYDISEDRILYKLDELMSTAGFNVGNITNSMPETLPIALTTIDYKPLAYPLLDLAIKSNLKLMNLTNSINDSLNQTGDGLNTVASAPADATNPGAENQILKDSIPTLQVDLGFNKASYESLIAFISNLEAVDRAVIINHIDASKALDSTSIEGTIVLSIYALPKVNELDSEDIKFVPLTLKGKINPFI